MDTATLKKLNLARYEAAIKVADTAVSMRVQGREIGKNWRLNQAVSNYHAVAERYVAALRERVAEEVAREEGGAL